MGIRADKSGKEFMREMMLAIQLNLVEESSLAVASDEK